MKKIIDELINNSIRGVDVYRYKNATWLIFTDENRWIVELTDEGTLWYNYKFFNDIMRYVSMDPKEYEGYITGWANDYFYKDVKEMGDSNSIRVQNRGQNLTWRIVKSIKPHRVVVPAQGMDRFYYDPGCSANTTDIFRIIEEGIKNTMPSKATSKSGIHFDDVMCSGNITDIFLIVEGGIKNTWPDKIPHDYDWSDEFDADKVIEVGVKL